MLWAMTHTNMLIPEDVWAVIADVKARIAEVQIEVAELRARESVVAGENINVIEPVEDSDK